MKSVHTSLNTDHSFCKPCSFMSSFTLFPNLPAPTLLPCHQSVAFVFSKFPYRLPWNSPFDSPSLNNFDRAYHMLSLTNFQLYECDKRIEAILYVVCFRLLVSFCRYQWHLIYIFTAFPQQIFLTVNYFPEIISRIPGITAISYLPPPHFYRQTPNQ